MLAEVCKHNRSEKSFRVNTIQDLTSTIIPHFENYTLFSQKSADFKLFKLIIHLINNKAHLNDLGLEQIVNIRIQ